ncbi:MAG: ABC transporter permease [Thermoleophilia bacterium]|nr:ABC transporter permease [Thermoleophilia bacterium]
MDDQTTAGHNQVDALPRAVDRPMSGIQERAAKQRREWHHVLLLTPAVLWVLFAVLVPVAMIVWVSFRRMKGGLLEPALTIENWTTALSQGITWTLVFRTLWTTGVVLVIVAALGLTAGYFLSRFVKKPRTQALLLMLAILPFWTSYIIRIVTWQPLLGERGVLNWTLVRLGIINEPSSAFLFNQGVMMFAMVSLYVVFVIGPVYWAFGTISPDVVAAARSLGATPWKAFWTVELPLAKGGLVAGSFFAAIFLFGDYATERLIGGGTHPALAGTVKAYAGYGQWPAASALGVLLIVMVFLVLGLFMKFHNLRREL